MTKTSNIEAIQTTTGTPWEEWVAFLDSRGAKDLSHTEIANIVRDKLSGKLDNNGWWAQSVTVAYEQHIGRRLPGQRSDGTFECAVSKTIHGDLDAAMNAWLQFIDGKQAVNNVAFNGEPSQTTPKRGRHWACNLEDGSRLNADAYPKSPEKTTLTITHQKFATSQEAQSWQAYWKQQITTL